MHGSFLAGSCNIYVPQGFWDDLGSASGESRLPIYYILAKCAEWAHGVLESEFQYEHGVDTAGRRKRGARPTHAVLVEGAENLQLEAAYSSPNGRYRLVQLGGSI